MNLLNSHYGYRLFMDDYGDTWCATLVRTDNTWNIVALGAVNGKWGWDALNPKKAK